MNKWVYLTSNGAVLLGNSSGNQQPLKLPWKILENDL